jgi:uncharacterized protein YggE
MTSMKTPAALLMSAALFFATPLPAQNYTVITTSGVGEVSRAPDHAVVSLGLSASARSADQASSSLRAILEGTRSALVGAGVAEDSVTTGYFNVSAVYGTTPETRRVRQGYQARMVVQVSVHDLERLGEVIDAGIAAGNELHGVTFDLADRAALRSQALTEAVRKARADAEVLARAAGGTIGGLLELSTEGQPVVQPYQVRREAAVGARSNGPDLNPQEIAVRATVVAKYAMVLD